MIGTTIHGRYRILEELGKGGMGTVYRALDTFLEREVAIKLLTGRDIGSEGRARLLNEARAIAQLNHPHIITVYDAGEYRGKPFIVMELLHGQSLYEQRPEGLEQMLGIIRQVCEALDHAHKRGIIHRDIKPENVFITTEGTVKLMDFGLARALASRLSGTGTLVGTVFYIAPEQALGQEIDQRADLYALGVMLYELVTGQLPFTGVDPFAVITQHLYASVVPPRARKPEIPAYLEALILQLLSKRREERPASASEVIERLAAGEAWTAQPSEAGPVSMLDRIVRGKMVGRQRELNELRLLWKKTQAGQGQFLLISGEPGIGKSRLVRELATQVDVSGRSALVGECYAEGGAPYSPFAPALSKALEDGAGDGLAQALPGAVLADLLTIAPELRLRFPEAHPNPPLDPLAEQQRLFENVTTFFAAYCQRTPTLVVLEDVHWADQGSLALLRHLARRLHSQALMIVATYREVELDKSRPFHDTLLAIQRERLGSRIKLTRLDRAAARGLLETLLDAPVTDDFLDAIYQETEGNPFFMEEVCKDLVDSGKLRVEEPTEIGECCHWIYPSRQELQIPQSVRVAIQARVERLPESTQQALQMAAIVGREFDFDTLREMTGLAEDDLVDALESAEHAQIVEEVSSAAGGTFSFLHALIPAALSDSLSGIRRRRVHRRAGETLEKLHPEDYEALAYQYARAEVEEKALYYLNLAGQRAQARFANDEAAQLYSQALDFAQPVTAQAFDLHRLRAQVYELSARREQELADVQAMLDLAERLDDDERRFIALNAQIEYYLNTKYSQARQLAERLLELARQRASPVWEGRALYSLGVLAYNANGGSARCTELFSQAAALLQQAGLLGEASASLSMLSLGHRNLGDREDAWRTIEQALELSRQAGDVRQEAICLRRQGILLMEQRRFSEAIGYAEQALKLHRQVGDRAQETHGLNVIGRLLYSLGQYDEAVVQLEQGLALAESIDFRQAAAMISFSLADTCYRALGLYEKELEVFVEQAAKSRQANDLAQLEGYLAGVIDTLTNLGQFEGAGQALDEVEKLVEKRQDKQALANVQAQRARLHAEVGELEQARECARRSLQLLEEDGSKLDTAPYFACAYIAWMGQDAEEQRQGLEHIRQAIATLRELQADYALVYALDMQARLHLALGETDAALECTSQVTALGRSETDRSPEQFFFTHAHALRAAGREAEADEYLRRAYERLLHVATSLHTAAYMQSYLNGPRYHRELREEGRAVGSKQ